MDQPTRTEAYRCVIPTESSAAVLVVGRVHLPVRVLEESRRDFVIAATEKQLGVISRSTEAYLDFRGERWIVHKSSEFHGSEPFIRVVLDRLAEMRQYRPPRTRGSLFSPQWNTNSDPALLLGLSTAFIVSFCVMPGVGDRLGIQRVVAGAVQTVWQALSSIFL